MTSLPRLRGCGQTAVTDGGVTVGVATNLDGTTHAGYGGVSTCGSVWTCPQCAAKIATRRADELADVMRAIDATGGSAFMLTLTLRHSRGDRLGWDRDHRRQAEGIAERTRARARARERGDQVDEDAEVADVALDTTLAAARGCWDALGHAWARVTSGGTWVRDQDRHGGLLGWARVVEVTHGANGWHTHVHALLAYADDVSAETLRPVAARMFGRWRKGLEDRGFDASGDLGADGKIPGWDLRRVQLHDGDLADYFTKMAHEVTGAHRKEGRRPGGKTPMQLLADAVETYEATTVACWWEYESASAGRRQLTWSGGHRDLRALAQLAPEQTDEEIAAEEIAANERLGLPAETWGWIRSGQHETTVLDVAETEQIDGVIRWLDDRGLSFVRGAGTGWAEPPDTSPDVPVPRDAGVGYGWCLATPAVLRGRDSAGRLRRRPSDRPPRWTLDARAVLAAP